MMYKMLCVYFIAIFWGCNPKTKSNDQIKQVKDYYNQMDKEVHQNRANLNE